MKRFFYALMSFYPFAAFANWSLDYDINPPQVIIQRSVFDYPENFAEVYMKPECHTSPLGVQTEEFPT